MDKFFIQMSISVLKKKKHFVEKLLSFEKWQESCKRFLYQNPFYMFIKMLDEIKEKLTPKIYPLSLRVIGKKIVDFEFYNLFIFQFQWWSKTM